MLKLFIQRKYFECYSSIYKQVRKYSNWKKNQIFLYYIKKVHDSMALSLHEIKHLTSLYDEIEFININK